jgi:hypothetical protein
MSTTPPAIAYSESNRVNFSRQRRARAGDDFFNGINYDWNAIADGRYYVEWYAGGTRRRVSAGVTAAQALEVQRRKHHELEGRKLGIPGFETAGETVKKAVLQKLTA